MTEIIIAVIGSSALSALISGVFSTIEKRRQKDDAIQLLLYHDIKAECKEYIARGSIRSDEYEVLVKMHDTYHKRGGNGFLDRFVQEALKQPICEE